MAGSKLKKSTPSSKSEEKCEEMCIVCGGEPATNIVRDANFLKVMEFFIEGLSIDVKPAEYKEYELCTDCFDIVVEFYDTNDVLLLLEKHLGRVRNSIITKTMAQIKERNKLGEAGLPFHIKFTQKHGDKPPAEEKPNESESVISSLEDEPETSSPKKSSQKKKGRVSRVTRRSAAGDDSDEEANGTGSKKSKKRKI